MSNEWKYRTLNHYNFPFPKFPVQNWIIRTKLLKSYSNCNFGKVKCELRVTSNLWVTSSNPQVTSSNPQVTSSNPQVTSSNPQVRRLKAWVGRLKAQVTRLKTQVRRFKVWVEGIKPQAR